MIPKEAIEAAVQAREKARRSIQGFLYGDRHVIRDMRREHATDEVWVATGDYASCHESMMEEIERRVEEEALTAAFAAMSEPVAWMDEWGFASTYKPHAKSVPLYAAPQPASVKVKPLEWEEYNRGEWRAFTAFGTYWCGGEGWSFGSDEDWRAGNIDYAQADYEARILSTLTSAPDLASENERLRAVLRNAPNLRHFEILAEAMAEVKATNDGQSDQTITEIVDGCLAEIAALEERT